jgi:hypothetical protein
MANKYCRVGQRLFTKVANYEGSLRRAARRTKPNPDEVKKFKDWFTEAKDNYTFHAGRCDTCGPL